LVALQLVPVILSLLVLAAHFLRYGSVIPVAVCLVLIAVLGVRRPWTAHAVRIALVLGALEWVRTLVRLASIRQEIGAPAGRLVLILGSVAAATALSTLVFRAARVRAWFRLSGPDGPPAR